MFLPVRQIECSSISEHSERIIKSNHLDSGKISSCLVSVLLIQQINTGLKKEVTTSDLDWKDGRSSSFDLKIPFRGDILSEYYIANFP